MSAATFGPIPGVSAICSGVASSSASIERKRWARLRPGDSPTPSMPTPNRTRPNGRSFEAWMRSTRRVALTSPMRSTPSSCSAVSR
jgi:hypothetical protein